MDADTPAGSFDALAAEYHRFRPGYPDATFDALPQGADVTLIDIGAGTGQATRALAQRAGRVVAVEPGHHLAALATEVLADLPHVHVVQSSFEELHLPAGSADGAFAGTSWHWVDPDVGTSVLARLLRPGGIVTLAWNRPAFEPLGHRRVGERLDDLVAQVAPHLSRGTWTTAGAVEKNVEALARRGFSREDHRTLCWHRDLDGPTARGLFGTYSAYSTADPSIRDRLLDGIAQFIDEEPQRRIRTEMVTDVYVLTAAKPV